jgi:peptide-methionine (S)-S-oxide reductase
MLKHPDHPYIVAWDAQKVANLRKLYPSYYVAEPALSS